MMNFFNMLAECFDLPILDWIQAHLQCGFLDTVMPIVTLFGEHGLFWIACALLLLLSKKHRKTGFAMGAALLIGLLICNMTLKPLVGRIRPYDYQLQNFGVAVKLLVDPLHDASFPSGHTIASFEACTVLMLHDKRLGIPATILAVLVALSRLYLYVHYPTDVITAVILGIAFGFLGNWLVNMSYRKYELSKAKRTQQQ